MVLGVPHLRKLPNAGFPTLKNLLLALLCPFCWDNMGDEQTVCWKHFRKNHILFMHFFQQFGKQADILQMPFE